MNYFLIDAAIYTLVVTSKSTEFKGVFLGRLTAEIICHVLTKISGRVKLNRPHVAIYAIAYSFNVFRFCQFVSLFRVSIGFNHKLLNSI